MRPQFGFSLFARPGLQGFLSVALLGWLFWLLLLVFLGYEGSFLLLNGWHFPALDALMPHYTHLSDGAVLGGLVGLILARKNLSPALALIVALLMLPFVITLLKMYAFPDWSRPPVVFAGKAPIHYLTVMKETQNSFPSGHSATAFMVLAFAALAVDKTWKGAILGLLAISLAWSRVYIGVHFVGDILAGSLMGFLLMLAVWLLTRQGFESSVAKWTSKKKQAWSWSLMGIGGFFFLAEVIHLYLNYYRP